MTSIDGPPYSPLSKGQTMNKFQNCYRATNRTTQFDVNRGKTFWFALPIVVIASIVVFTAQAQSPRSHSSSPTPGYRFETLKLKAKGLLPNTTFSVFLAADFLGEIATNADGRGSLRAAAVVEGNSLRNNPNPAVLRFASPAADDVCFTPVYGEDEATAFLRRNVLHRRSASATTTLITDSRSTNDDASIFHIINWRFIKCVSTF
jgi:hypothetical protein